MNHKMRLIVVAVIVVVLATVCFVAADEAGIITINIFNSPNSQVYTNISNSSIQGQINFTDSQASENITLTNSTLTLNINGQNVTIISQVDNTIVTVPGQSAAKPDPLYVSFLKSHPTENQIISGSGITQYDFNVTVTVPTGMNYPFGVNASTDKIRPLLLPIASKYGLETRMYNATGSAVTEVVWTDKPVVSGENVFSLFSSQTLSVDQIKSLTDDLFDMFTVAMSSQG